MKGLIVAINSQGKIEAANKYLEGNLVFQACDYNFKESQHDSLEAYAIVNVREAYENTKLPSVVINVGFYVEELNGYPGADVRQFLDTMGIKGLLKLLQGEDKRECCFRECLAYYDGNGQPQLFWGEYKGSVAQEIKEEIVKRDWADLSYIFIPEHKDIVWAEMSDEERQEFSKYHEDTSAIKHFKEWYTDYLISKDYYGPLLRFCKK